MRVEELIPLPLFFAFSPYTNLDNVDACYVMPSGDVNYLNNVHGSPYGRTISPYTGIHYDDNAACYVTSSGGVYYGQHNYGVAYSYGI